MAAPRPTGWDDVGRPDVDTYDIAVAPGCAVATIPFDVRLDRTWTTIFVRRGEEGYRP